jgi:hypothetical protein
METFVNFLNRRRTRVFLLGGCFLSVPLLVLILFQPYFWEAALRGPYEGAVYLKIPVQTPLSELKLRSGATLKVSREAGEKDLVLALVDVHGVLQWTRLLVAIEPSGDRFSIGQIQMRGWSENRAHIKVRISVNWSGGGIEGGVIYLNRDETFSHFALSW